jgi:hypothetical protein
VNLTVQSVVDMIDGNDRTVPNWLPLLLGVKATSDNLPQLALQCFLLPINGEIKKCQSYNVITESIKILKETSLDNEQRNQWYEIGKSALSGLSKENLAHPITQTLQGTEFKNLSHFSLN